LLHEAKIIAAKRIAEEKMCLIEIMCLKELSFKKKRLFSRRMPQHYGASVNSSLFSLNG
jgi:hypothetical protein